MDSNFSPKYCTRGLKDTTSMLPLCFMLLYISTLVFVLSTTFFKKVVVLSIMYPPKVVILNATVETKN